MAVHVQLTSGFQVVEYIILGRSYADAGEKHRKALGFRITMESHETVVLVKFSSGNDFYDA